MGMFGCAVIEKVMHTHDAISRHLGLGNRSDETTCEYCALLRLRHTAPVGPHGAPGPPANARLKAQKSETRHL